MNDTRLICTWKTLAWIRGEVRQIMSEAAEQAGFPGKLMVPHELALDYVYRRREGPFTEVEWKIIGLWNPHLDGWGSYSQSPRGRNELMMDEMIVARRLHRISRFNPPVNQIFVSSDDWRSLLFVPGVEEFAHSINEYGVSRVDRNKG